MSAAWLALWVAAIAWASFTLATAWPYVQLMPQWILVFGFGVILFRAFDLFWTKRKGQRIAGWKRFGARVAAFIAGAFVGMNLAQVLEDVSMGRFERALAPVVEQIHANAAAPCVKYTISPDLAAYLTDAGAPRAPADLHHDKQRFVLTLRGWSMDIDGSTMFYDSGARAWKKVHNDILASTGELDTLKKGLESCRIELR